MHAKGQLLIPWRRFSASGERLIKPVSFDAPMHPPTLKLGKRRCPDDWPPPSLKAHDYCCVSLLLTEKGCGSDGAPIDRRTVARGL
jgi:hypothetical protein